MKKMEKIDVFYSCPYCGEEYANPGDLARCILSCEEKKKIEEEKKREEALAAEKNARKKEVDEAVKKCKELIKAYMIDYGVYAYESDESIFDMFSSKFWNYIV